MSLENDINLLRQVQMFSDFHDEHLRLIAFGSQKISHVQGYELFREGQATDGGYVVVSGQIELLSFQNENVTSLGLFGPGSLLGEIALISMNKRVGTAIVRQDCEVLKISRIVMHRILNEYPELAVSLQRKISASIISFTKDLEKVRF